MIGVAGDTIICCDEQGRLEVNGYALDETDYATQDGSDCAAPNSTQGRCMLDVGPIPDGYLFVMGDYRSNSKDSSGHLCSDQESQQCPPTSGLVPVRLVVGKVFALVWPQERWDRITRPDIFEDIPDPE